MTIVASNVDDKLFVEPTIAPPVNDISAEPAATPDVHADKVDDYAISDPHGKPTTSDTAAPVTTDTAPAASDHDEYGTPITAEKPAERIYTEAEVNAIVRDRLSRGKFADQQPQQPPQQQHQAQQGDQFQYNDQSGESWEVQLERFVEATLTKRESRVQEENWRMQEQHRQAEFEIKFNSGAAKYADFERVVTGKSLTPDMVIATRGMDNPAAFIYAAAKTQPQELDRISRINDPYTQAVEMGRLEERMRKSRQQVSSAPKPFTAPQGESRTDKPKPRGVDDILLHQERIEKERKQRR